MFSRWDLKFLDDPKGIYGSAEKIHIYSRKGFEEDMPDAANLLKNLKFDDETLSDLINKIEENNDKDPLDVAKEWVSNHEDQVNIWLGK
jgi:glycine betaine/proline transport system substrate-binding protein